MEFIEILIDELKKREITEYKACKDAGIPKNSISNWKNGTIPSIDKLKKIALYLDVEPGILLGISPKKRNELNQLESELLTHFRKLDRDEQLKYIGRIEADADRHKQITRSSTLKSG